MHGSREVEIGDAAPSPPQGKIPRVLFWICRIEKSGERVIFLVASRLEACKVRFMFDYDQEEAIAMFVSLLLASLLIAAVLWVG